MLFDFGGTLDADGIHWAPRFHAAYRAAGGTLDFAAFEPYFKASDDELARLPGIRDLGFRAAISAQARIVCGQVPDGANLVAAAMAAQVHAAAVAVVSRNRPVLDRLRRTHRLAVISNFTGNLGPCLAELDLLRFFAVISDSALVGVAKPDPRIFTDTLTRLGAPASAAWMVGDNFESDIRPAAALGMRTCWLAPSDRTPPPGGGLPPTARITRLPEVETALCERGACTA